MIAAGSLFTSCIEPVEPAGIYDLREAKARYYDALSKLRAADALLVEAKADLKKADAEFRRAEVEYQNLVNEAKKLENEALKLGNEKEAAKWAMKLEELKKQHELNMINYEGQIAQAQENLRQILSDIEMAALDLTDAEKKALSKAIREYEKAYQAWTDAQEAVTAAESALWSAQYDMNNQKDDAGLIWDPLTDFYLDGIFTEYYYLRTGLTTPEYYESVIEYATMYAAYFAQLIATFEADPDVTAWAEELTELKEELDQVKYNRYQVTKDSVYYMANVYHDGAPAYKKAVEDWLEANNIRVESDKTQYKVGDDWITMNKPIAPGEKGFDPYTYYGNEVVWVEDDEYRGIPALEEDGSIAYAKFNYLLNDYFTKISEAGDGTEPFMTLNGTDLEINANQMMKEFILGGETETPFVYENEDGSKVTAKYGLVGALSVLKRELVLSDDPAATPDSLKTLAEKALKQWKDDRAILDAGLANFKDYKDAMTAYDTKKQAYDKAVSDDKTGNANLANASKTLLEKLNGIVGHNDLSQEDTLALVSALTTFAEKREAYLPYTPYKNSGIDSNKFYYVYATVPVLVDSTLSFKDITRDLMRTKPAFSQWLNRSTNPWSYLDLNGTSFIDASTHTPVLPATQNQGAFANIFAQLLSEGAAKVVWALDGTITPAMMTNAFYNTYEYNATDNTIVVIATGDVYENPAVAKAADQLATAEKNVKEAAKKFVEVYNRFWAQTAETDITKDPYKKFNDYFNAVANQKAAKLQAALDAFKVGDATTILPLDHKCYKLETFTEPYNVVTFTNGELDYTKALGAILVSVDPAAAGHRDNQSFFEGWSNEPVIFGKADGTKQTEFYKYMLAEYKYLMATALTEEIIKDIEAWIDEVKAAFKANEDFADAIYKATNDVYDTYAALFKELTGKDAKNADDDAKAIVTTIGKPNKKYEAKGVKQTEETLYHWTGSWDLAGKQAEFAEQYIPEYPEKLAEWHTNAVAADHQIAHLEMIIQELEDAYIAAIAVAEGDATIPTEYDTVEEYLDDLIEDTIDEYTYYMEMYLMIAQVYEEALAKYNAGYDPKQINIEILEHALENAQLKLQDATIKLEVAEAYYNKVMTAILGKN